MSLGLGRLAILDGGLLRKMSLLMVPAGQSLEDLEVKAQSVPRFTGMLAFAPMPCVPASLHDMAKMRVGTGQLGA